MGSGISKTALMRHSDSRVEEIRAQIAAAGDRHRVTTASTGADDRNSTFSLRLISPEGSPQPPSRASDMGSPRGKRSRARSYTALDQLQVWQPVSALAALHEGPESGREGGAPSRSSSHASSSLPSSPHGAHESSPQEAVAPPEDSSKGSVGALTEEGDAYESEEFEDEITDWRKGEAIGSGSYGTASRGRPLFALQADQHELTCVLLDWHRIAGLLGAG